MNTETATETRTREILAATDALIAAHNTWATSPFTGEIPPPSFDHAVERAALVLCSGGIPLELHQMADRLLPFIENWNRYLDREAEFVNPKTKAPAVHVWGPLRQVIHIRENALGHIPQMAAAKLTTETEADDRKLARRWQALKSKLHILRPKAERTLPAKPKPSTPPEPITSGIPPAMELTAMAEAPKSRSDTRPPIPSLVESSDRATEFKPSGFREAGQRPDDAEPGQNPECQQSDEPHHSGGSAGQLDTASLTRLTLEYHRENPTWRPTEIAQAITEATGQPIDPRSCNGVLMKHRRENSAERFPRTE